MKTQQIFDLNWVKTIPGSSLSSFPVLLGSELLEKEVKEKWQYYVPDDPEMLQVLEQILTRKRYYLHLLEYVVFGDYVNWLLEWMGPNQE